jgi:hypothetical protein
MERSMKRENVRPFLGGPVHDLSGKDVPDYARYGSFGLPDGPVQRTRYEYIPATDWVRRYFDRPSTLVRDTPGGDLYVLFCGAAQAKPYTSAALKFRADIHREGQNVFIHRPGWYDFYHDCRLPLHCHVQDAASIYYTHPTHRDIQGFDATVTGHRVIGCTAADPAALWVYDVAAGAAITTVNTTLLAGNVNTAAIQTAVVGLTAPQSASVVQTFPAPTAIDSVVLAGIAGRKFASIYNDGAITVYIRMDGAAATVAALALAPGALLTIEPSAGVINKNEIHGITAGGTGSLAVEEWT